jgi:hypothetical protein
VRSSGIGILLEKRKLEEYERLLTRALHAYKNKYKIIDSHGGKMIKCSFQKITTKEATAEELSAPFDRIIMVKDNKTFVQLKGDAFTSYQKQYCEGLFLLGTKPKLSGILVRVQT